MVKNANARQVLPKFLYKYYPLFDDEEKSNQRLDSIRQSYFWLANYWEMNDPTEFNYYNSSNENYELLLRPNSYWPLTSFSKKGYNLPMWSHYANGHKGFCVKFKVHADGVNIYKVDYSSKAKSIDEHFFRHPAFCKHKEMYKLLQSRAEEAKEYSEIETQEFMENFQSVATSKDFCDLILSRTKLLYQKHSDWRYEQEYRIIVPDEFEFCNENLLPFENSFLDPIEILIGINIEEKYEKELKDIANHLGIGAKKIKLQDFYK